MAHSYAKLLFHFIFSTKGRAADITPMMRDRLYAYIGGILRNEQGHLLKAGGTANHVHLLIELKSAMAVADAIRLIKANSSKWVHETFSDHAKFGWQTGYGAFSVSLSAVDEIVTSSTRFAV
jgi:REP element-mobilizing transposase RayT